MRFVLDASVALSWCLDDESDGQAQRVATLMAEGSEAIVPSLWAVEIVSGLSAAERRRRITKEESARRLAFLADMPILVVDPEASFLQVAENLLALTRLYHVTAYDACYLGLAWEKDLPLATLDKALARAASILNIPVLPDEL